MLYRNARKRSELTEPVGVPMSPLIDCVFLLLIFFLVTSMLKRKETIIPITMPDASSSLEAQTHDDTTVIGLSDLGAFLEPVDRNAYGAITYQQGSTLEQYLDRLLADQGVSVREKPIRFDVARLTPFQRTIDALDTCKLRGFTNVSVKIRQPFTD